jgi:osmotically-inducible protein OsmY
MTPGAPGGTTTATGGTGTTPPGGATSIAAADLPAAVTSKLTEKLPNGNFTVEAKDGAVTVSGTVPSATEKKRIEPLVKEVKGVKTVKVDVKVEPTKAPAN